MISEKKGNVDTDIVFTMLSKIIDKEKFDKIVLVSSDGDYFKTVKYLIGKDKFLKLFAPNRHSTSTLYCPFTPKYVSYLDAVGTKEKIMPKKSENKKRVLLRYLSVRIARIGICSHYIKLLLKNYGLGARSGNRTRTDFSIRF